MKGKNLPSTIDFEIEIAKEKAIDSLARYKFAMFGYWAGIWVHLNRISNTKRENPFRPLVENARAMQSKNKTGSGEA